MSKPNLKERVQAFNALELPGQPQMMHMATSYLVADLWAEIERLRDEARIYVDTTKAVMADVERLRARNAELVAAAKAFEAGLSEYCDGPERDVLRAALAKAEEKK